MLCHRKSASRLSMGTSISCNMAIPGKLPEIAHMIKRPALLRFAEARVSGGDENRPPSVCLWQTLRPEIDKGSGQGQNLAIRHCRGAASACAGCSALCLIGPSPAFIRHRRRRDTALGPANPALRIVDEGAVAPAAFS